MKTAVLFLVVLGLIAAGSATLLVKMVTRPVPPAVTTTAPEDAEVTVMIAAQDLPAMTVVSGAMVETKQVPKSQLPEGALLNSVQIVGKITTRPMVSGELFAQSSFAQPTQGLYLAAAVPQGMRAVTIAFQDNQALAGILYPGSVVDVMVSLQSGAEGRGGSPVATTLLQSLQVLAIGTQTITQEQEFDDRNPGAMARRGQINHRNVTLLVTPRQAAMLQLAVQHGTISLAMRNPLDTQQVSQEFTQFADFAGASRQQPGPAERSALAEVASFLQRMSRARATTQPSETAQASAAPDKPAAPAEVNPLWEILVVRGTAAQTQTFPMPQAADEAAGADPGLAVDRGKASSAAPGSI